MIPTLTPVTSSNVAAIGHADDKLYVAFMGGSLYEYDNVPHSVYVAFLNAPSKGSFVWEELRDRYPYRKLSQT